MTGLRPSALFTDGTVLCRRKEIRLFGEAADGATVSASLTDAEGRVLAENAATAGDGRFLVTLPPQEARTGCRLTFTDGVTDISADNVAVGEVYLAGGQSNMELELRNAAEGPEIIPALSDPMLRFFNVPKKAIAGDGQRQAFGETRWHAADPETGGFNSAVATIFALRMREKHPDVPVGVIDCYWGGTSVSCWMDEETLNTLDEGKRYLAEYAARSAGKGLRTYLAEEEAHNRGVDAWNSRVETCRKAHPEYTWQEIEQTVGACPWDPPAGPGSPFRPGGLAETMLCAVSPAALTACLYYQGEDDTGRTDDYDILMTAMIGFWRKLFRDPELPFLFVQLPMWIGFGAEDSFRWAQTRLAQARVRDTVANTGMICLLDQGEYGNIHPVHKQPVGERLAELMTAMRGEGGAEAPRAVSADARGEILTVRLTSPVHTRDGKAPALTEIAGEDGRFVPAEAEIVGDTLRLRAEGIMHPAFVRYAWTDWSDRVNLFGENGLPLEPFWLEADELRPE